MPDKKGRFTPRERVFVKHVVDSGSPAYAAHRAGYASPEVSGSRLIAKPELAAEVAKVQLHRIRTEILPQAVKRHLAVLADERVTGQALNRAIELAYKYGLAEGAEGQTKEPADMTPEELGRAIDALKRAAADQAKPVLDLEAEPSTSSVFD